jgi:DNA topoisomerase-1
VGRVQTPLLALVVDREKDIKSFTPTPYWELYATFSNEEEFVAGHVGNRFIEKAKADAILARLGKAGRVVDYRKEPKAEYPPIPFSTTEFIRAAASIGFSAANAMRVAENLYVNGWISYPRTDNTVYPASLNLREVVSQFTGGEFAKYAERLLAQGSLKPTRGKKETTDHPPIYPVASARKSDLRADEWRVYELVVSRFFATLAPPAEWEVRSACVDVNGEKFKAAGSMLSTPGWRLYYPYGMPKEELLPELKINEELRVGDVKLDEKLTKPPVRYGQGKLVKMMEDLGLGTKSTRHEAIQKLYARSYVHGNPPQPTNTAFAVVEALEKYADLITKPDMTSRLEADMDNIAEGKIKEEDVVKESQGMLETIFGELEGNQKEIRDVLYDGLRGDKLIGKCPSCGKDLLVRKSKKGGRFIGCDGYPECNFILPLPRMGTVVVTDKSCEKHGISHIKIVNGGSKPWDLGCPQCNYEEWQKKNAEKKITPVKKSSEPAKKPARKAKASGKKTAEGSGTPLIKS